MGGTYSYYQNGCREFSCIYVLIEFPCCYCFRTFAWGANGYGQLGTGPIVHMNPKPKLVGDLDFVAIEAGREWKTQQKQQQQQKQESNDQSPPVETPKVPSSSHSLANIPKIIRVEAKGNTSVAISNFGHCYAWGCNDIQNLGLPKPDPATLTYVDPGQPITKTTTLRQVNTYSFDSSHNVALPQRLDSIRHLDVFSVGLSPTFLWCLGKERKGKDDPSVGRTLYEIQEAKRQKSLQIHYERILRTVDTGSFSVTGNTGRENTVDRSTSQSQIEQQDGQLPSEDIKIASEQETVGEAPVCNDDGFSEEGSTSQHSKLLESSSHFLDSAHFGELSNQEDSFSNTAPGKKKRMFSTKKFMKAIARRASGSSSK